MKKDRIGLMMTSRIFKNKTIVITGAAGGIGQELVGQLASKGACVHALDIDLSALKKLRKKMEDKGFEIEVFKLDVTSATDFNKYAENFTRSDSSPFMWINNAGIAYPQSFLKTTVADFERIISVNLTGVIQGTYAAYQLMNQTQLGTIVNVASVAGHIPSPYLSAYATSKHGVVGFTRSLQAELQLMASPIKLVLVSPGFCDTAIMQTNEAIRVPNWLKSTPKKVASQIVKGLSQGKKEIYPAFSGSLMMKLYRLSPKLLNLSARSLAAENVREFVGIDGIEK